MRIGVISDTHGYFDPKVRDYFQGVEHILHAGDIGLASVIHELEAIAPVTAVLGNTDSGLAYRETEVVVLGSWKFMVHHIVTPHGLSGGLQERLRREPADVVIFGHTHKPFCERVGRTLFLNPGYAGKPRFNLERSVAILESDARGLSHRFHEL